MTESQWAKCTNASELLDYHTMKKDPRRLRLLAAACVRLVVTDDTAPLALQVLDVVEQYADGAVSRAEFLAARKAVRNAIKERTKDPAILAMKNLTDDAMEGMTVTVSNLGRRTGAGQCRLMRCLFGNPYRHVSLDPTCFTPTVLALARGIYTERAFDRMPILADALQEAGCEDATVIEHCRAEALHARGCWVIDRILGQWPQPTAKE